MRHPNQIILEAGPEGSRQWANGILLSPHLVLTCAHVFDKVWDAPHPVQGPIKIVVGLSDGSGTVCTAGLFEQGWFPMSGKAPVSDLAILTLDQPWPCPILVIAGAEFPNGTLTGAAWDLEKPGFVDFTSLKASDQGFATASGVLGLMVADGGPASRPGYSGFPIFNALGRLAGIHQQADDYDPGRRLVAASARMIRAALRLYALRGGSHAIILSEEPERPDIDDEGRVLRRREYQEAIDALLAQPSKSNTMTAITSLSGDGGFGKTTLARMIFEDPQVRDQLGATVGWITIGREPGDIASEYAGLARGIDRAAELMGSADQVARQLADFLANREGLIVVDDVWNERYLEPFMKAGPKLRLLVTTRNRAIAGRAGKCVEVDEMARPDATLLISRGLSVKTEAERAALADLAFKLHNCAQWIEAANGLLLRRIREGRSLLSAIKTTEQGYRAEGFEFLESHQDWAAKQRSNDPLERRKSIAATQLVALREFDDDAVQAYMSLAVLPEDMRVPRDVIFAYWGVEPSITPRRAGNLLDGFVDLCLVERPRPGSDAIGLHDTKRDWLIAQVGAIQLAEAHWRMAQVLERLQLISDPLVRRYAWQHQIPHLRAADRDDEANAKLVDYLWIASKLDEAGVEGLRADHETVAAKPERRDAQAKLVGRALIWDAPLLQRAPSSLPSLVLGRFRGNDAFASALSQPREILAKRGVSPVLQPLKRPGAGLLVLEGHKGQVHSAVYSPDGATVLTASADHTVRLWRAFDGAPGPLLEGHSGRVLSALFSHDGTRVVSASDDGTARIWCSSDGTNGPILKGHLGPVLGAVFSPDGATALTASADHSARLWRASDGALISKYEGHRNWVRSAVFSPDGMTVITASSDGSARLWRALDARPGPVLMGHSSEVRSAVFSPDGSQVLTSSADGTARLWRASDGEPGPVLTGHDGRVLCAIFSPDGSIVLTASDDRTARLWRASDGLAGPVLEGHGGGVRSAAFSPDGATVLTASDYRTARLWRRSDGTATSVLEGHGGGVRSAVFSPDGATVLTASKDHTARLWRACDEAAEGATREGHAGRVWSSVISSDELMLLTASYDRTARFWRVSDGTPGPTLVGHSGGVLCAAISPDGSTAVSASMDHSAQLWRVSDGARGPTLEGHSNWVLSAVFSPDGMMVLTTSRDGTGRLWRTTDGAPGPVLIGHTDWVRSAEFSPDGAVLLTASEDSTVRIWHLPDGAPGPVLKGHRGRILSAVFGPDGGTVLTASSDHTARIWRSSDGAPGPVLEGHGGKVSSAVFSPDGESVLTASDDRTARLWHASVGDAGPVLRGHYGSVSRAVFSPDGATIVTVSDDRTARLWSALDGAEIVALACDAAAQSVALSAHYMAIGDLGGSVQIFRVDWGRLRQSGAR